MTASDIVQELEYRRALRDTVLGRTPSPADARSLADIACERATLACGLALQATDDADRARALGEALAAFAEGAAAGAAAALGVLLDEAGEAATLTLSWPEGDPRRVPIGGTMLDPSEWLRCVGSALVARDREALAVLCRADSVDAVQAPRDVADAFWPPMCRAVAAIMRRDADPTSDLAAAAAELEPGHIVCGDPATITSQIAPLLPILGAIAGGGAVDAAVRDAVSTHAAYFAAHGERDDPYRHVALEVLGLAALAHDRGQQVVDPRLPMALVQGAVSAPLVAVTVNYAPRYAARAEDSTGFFDLRGYPRRGRDHVLLARGPLMLARYTVSSNDGLPRATAEFRLADDAAQSRPPAALDPGERLLLAERYANESAAAAAADDTARAATWRANAVDAVDAVLATIPDGADTVPDSAFVSVRGRALLAREPGRVRRERLVAYRNALAGTSENVAQAVAMLSAELLKGSLHELLTAIARDRTRIAALRPRDVDYARVFTPDAQAVARAGFAKVWSEGPGIDALAGRELVVHVAPAGMLREDNALSRPFPSGYRAVARFLQPQRVWATWRYVEPGTSSGLTYDGLVWCDDRWSWFPKPFRVLRALVQ